MNYFARKHGISKQQAEDLIKRVGNDRDKLNAAANRAIQQPETKERLAQLGSEGGGGTPEQFAALIRRDSAKWAEVVRRSGAKID